MSEGRWCPSPRFRLGVTLGTAAALLRARISSADGSSGRCSFSLLWHLASTLQWVDPRFVPSPLTVLHSLWIWMFGPAGAGPYSGTWFLHAGNSAYRVLIGFLAAAAAGVVIGCLIGWFKACLRYPRSGHSDRPPHSDHGLGPVCGDLFRHPRRRRIFPDCAWRVFPHRRQYRCRGCRDAEASGAGGPNARRSTPTCCCRASSFPPPCRISSPGLRLGIGLAWVLVIVAEMMAVKSGLGFAMWDAYYFLRLDIIIASMLSVGDVRICQRSDHSIHRPLGATLEPRSMNQVVTSVALRQRAGAHRRSRIVQALHRYLPAGTNRRAGLHRS